MPRTPNSSEWLRLPAFAAESWWRLRWRDLDFAGRKLIVGRSMSHDTELRSTKSRRVREVPLPDQAAAALDRLSFRAEFTGPDDYVFANRGVR